MDKFQAAIREGQFSNTIVGVRDMLQVIVDGEIDRLHCSPGVRECYGGKPGKRKLLLADARSIARRAIVIIDRAVNEFHDSGD